MRRALSFICVCAAHDHVHISRTNVHLRQAKSHICSKQVNTSASCRSYMPIKHIYASHLCAINLHGCVIQGHVPLLQENPRICVMHNHTSVSRVITICIVHSHAFVRCLNQKGRQSNSGPTEYGEGMSRHFRCHIMHFEQKNTQQNEKWLINVPTIRTHTTAHHKNTHNCTP